MTLIAIHIGILVLGLGQEADAARPAAAAAAKPPEAERNLVGLAEASGEWLVSVFPYSRLGEGGDEDAETSIRERIWKRFGGEITAMAEKYLGTGIVIDPKGEVVTSNEVIPRRAEKVGVRFGDGRAFAARVVARYEPGNLALLQIEKADEDEVFPAARLGASSGLRPGNVVFSAGNVLDSIGIDGRPAVSRGVVSRLGPAQGAGLYRGHVIETDAAVNGGSYGGALLDPSGAVVGILDTGYSHRQWLGQAIPVEVLIEALPDLRQGLLPRHTLGFRARAEGDRVVVIDVAAGGPAAAGGLKAGDAILEANGERVKRRRDVDGLAFTLPVTAPIALRVRRGQEETEEETQAVVPTESTS